MSTRPGSWVIAPASTCSSLRSAQRRSLSCGRNRLVAAIPITSANSPGLTATGGDRAGGGTDGAVMTGLSQSHPRPLAARSSGPPGGGGAPGGEPAGDPLRLIAPGGSVGVIVARVARARRGLDDLVKSDHHRDGDLRYGCPGGPGRVEGEGEGYCGHADLLFPSACWFLSACWQ